MSSGLGRFNDRKTKQRYLQKKADEINETRGFMDPNYYETFDNFDPVIVRKEKLLFDKSETLEKLPFEKDGKIEPMFGPMNIGLTNSNNVPSSTHRRFKEMEDFYSSMKSKTGEENIQESILREAKENDKKMKQEIHRDHLAEMFGGPSFRKEPYKSEFQENFGRLASP
jgi:hypothetical protein